MPPAPRAPRPGAASGAKARATGRSGDMSGPPGVRRQEVGATTGTVNQKVAPFPGPLAMPISPP
jgi:hypothetical protein